ncbi:MFS general substrate transporter [Saccharata proteae CBS 121410]|uniref:MFS general substrate transporter n=1 Tax=Saccharata proteae CBS 121410 TaxID=1314787 RepID=A0A9P4HRK7_9PEZI|nr:MFS general substrate transporter [Saccharata proteae CBS 121410]
MYLTRQRTHPRDPNKFPTAQLAVLALVRVAEPIALTSIFPYAWQLVRHFKVTDENNAAFYAGILISAFALAEALTGMYWGGLSDRIGRKPVLLLGCAGTLLSLLVVGFATNFWIALLGRALGGILNGNIGVIQTMVGELVHKPEHEPRAYAIMPFIWSVGTIIGPSIGGYFANPSVNFPSLFPPGSLFDRFPYLLPNLICALMLFGSIIAGWLFLEETHPDMQPWSTQADLDNTTAETPLMPTQGSTAHAAANLTTESYGTFDAVDVQRTENWNLRPDGRPITPPTDHTKDKWCTRNVVMLVMALGLFTYHSMSYDVLLPIFLQDERAGDFSSILAGHTPTFAGGLGMTIQQVGLILSVNGVIALVIQAIVFPLMAAWLGVWKLFILVTIGHPIAYFIVPYLVVLPQESLYPAIYACLTVRNFFSILAYPLLLILIKEASPTPSHLGKINGLAASTGAACRTIASPVAGLLFSAGSRVNFTALPWWSSALVALVGAFQLPFIKRQFKKKTQVRAVAPCRFIPQENAMKEEVVHITVEDDDRV